jgi:hypothetical protein
MYDVSYSEAPDCFQGKAEWLYVTVDGVELKVR